MRKFVIIASVIFCVIILGILLISSRGRAEDVTAEVTKVGLVLNGSSKDNNWGQSHYEGLLSCADALNLNVIYRENVPEDEACTETIKELIEQGCKIIICNSFGFNNSVSKMAQEYPDVYFLHATGTAQDDNLTTYFGRMYQMRYLCGIVAGMQTETNEIGYLAAFPIDEVNRGINAFTLGVRSVNPDAVVYVEWSNSWTDVELTGNATEKLLSNKNIDVLAIHSDSNKPLEIAEHRGVWSIGYNIDNSKNFPEYYLTAPVWQWQNFYEPVIHACIQDKFEGKHYWLGIESGLVSLAPFTENVKEGIDDIIAGEIQKMQSGVFDVFYGPIVDNEGKLRVPEGESMSDNSMLNEFDWYVEGVVLNEEN